MSTENRSTAGPIIAGSVILGILLAQPISGAFNKAADALTPTPPPYVPTAQEQIEHAAWEKLTKPTDGSEPYTHATVVKSVLQNPANPWDGMTVIIDVRDPETLAEGKKIVKCPAQAPSTKPHCNKPV